MRGYNITDAELDSLGLIDTLAALFFSAGTGAMMFCINVTKDIVILEKKNEAAQVIEFSIRNFGFPLAILLYVVALLAICKRGTIVKRIKRESQNVAS